MSIKELIIKIKHFWQTNTAGRDKALTIAVIILVGTASFGLGRLSAYETKKEPVTIEMSEFSENSEAKTKPTVLGESLDLKEGGEVVASKTGDKYHFPWCAGAKRILESNKIYFKSAEEAKAAGYLPAANCKGLE